MENKKIQFTAAKGPIECTWVLARVLKFFLMELASNQIVYQVIHKENGIENGTVQSVTLELRGKQLSVFLNGWLGTIQWIGTSTFRKHYKRKNWYIGCFEIDSHQPKTISEKDIQFQAIRSYGPGGQHVNKVSSAIRAKHIPTGIQVLATQSRSQHQNKKIAITRLKEKLASHNRKQLGESVKNEWENHLKLDRGNSIRIFTGTDFKQKKQERSYNTRRNQLKNDLRNQIE